MAIGKQIRLNRIFSHPSGNLCSVAVDHFFGYAGGLPEGLTSIPKTLALVVAERPDAVTMQKGAAITCFGPHAGKVPLIMQAGCFTPDDRVIEVLTDPEECVRCGADAIAIAIGVRGPHEGQFVKILSDGVTAASKYDLPVIAHIYPRVYSQGGGQIVHDAANIAWAARVGIECGADVIKIGYTGDVESFARIVEASPVPVVAAGGPKAESLPEALRLMSEVVQAGGRGATIGRNVWGHTDIGEALRAFKAVIHDGKTPQEALASAKK